MKTLILFIDAFSFTDLNEKNAPFIFNLAKNGSYGPLTTIPAGYHIEYSMLSGSLPLKHNVWTWYYLKKNSSFSKIKYIKPLIKLLNKNEKMQRKLIDVYINLLRLLSGKTRFLKTNKIPINLLEKFEIAVDKSYVDHNPLNVPTLFDIFRKQNINYVAMEYPTISNKNKTWFYSGKDDFKQLEKTEKLLEKYDVVYNHIWNLDSIEHKYGLHSAEALEHIKKIDSYVEKIVLSQREPIKIVIFSDHGGCNVNQTKNILDILKGFNVDYFIGSTTCQIWFKEDNLKEKERLKNILKDHDYLIYDKKNIEKELKIPYKREFVGDILAWVKPGEQIYPDFFRDTDKVKSMHGYTQKVPEMAGIFIMNGFDKKDKKNKIKEMMLYDIAPTILKGFNMEIPKEWDGKARV
ncbi:MAG: alkaline phosphatase family protein [Nanoarchaeota archaeon]|nr:alkaline phosphatase family protein [Nanoarchaeota archaeon]